MAPPGCTDGGHVVVRRAGGGTRALVASYRRGPSPTGGALRGWALLAFTAVATSAAGALGAGATLRVVPPSPAGTAPLAALVLAAFTLRRALPEQANVARDSNVISNAPLLPAPRVLAPLGKAGPSAASVRIVGGPLQ